MNIFDKKKPHSRRKDRRSSKVVFRAEVNFDMQVLNAEILDISRAGLRFGTEKKLEKGKRVVIGFSVQEEDMEIKMNMNAKIVNDYGIDSAGRFTYGVKFRRLFSWYDMRRIERLVWSAELDQM